jgi:ABC-type molybdate transport system substrate-binding protein
MRSVFAGAFIMLSSLVHAETVNLYAAGSLKAALSEVARAFEKDRGDKVRVETVFGPSGLLRERIEKGEGAHVFASADLSHPQRLADQGRSVGPVRIFARNQLCALARADLVVMRESLLDVMLDTKVRIGTSTPKADPAGDYAFALFAKAERVKPGAQMILESKALQLTGGPGSEKAPPERNPYAWIMESGKVDLFLTYCTNAALAKKDWPALQVIQVPAELNVGAEYGMIVLQQAPTAASELVRFILGAQGQAIVVKHGFGGGDPAK